MTNAEKVQLMVQVANKIFASKVSNTDITTVTVVTNTGTHNGRWFSKGSLRGFDIPINNNGKIINLRIIEQNPNKMDNFGNLKQNALLARIGHQIVWIIRQDTNAFIGKVMDGTWTAITPKAITKIDPRTVVNGAGIQKTVTAEDQYGSVYEHYDDGRWVSELTEINPNDITVYIAGV